LGFGQQAGLAIDATETAWKGNRKLEICSGRVFFSENDERGRDRDRDRIVYYTTTATNH